MHQQMNAVELASLLCSRLCHDLLSPVGALNNGIELLADEQDPEMRERCLELLAESARASANKLKFFRLAFGAGGGFGDEIAARARSSRQPAWLASSVISTVVCPPAIKPDLGRSRGGFNGAKCLPQVNLPLCTSR